MKPTTEFINQVKTKANIEKILSDFTELKQKDNSEILTGNCTVGEQPCLNSLSVYPSSNYWECDTCFSNGDAITYYAQVNKISPLQAAKAINEKIQSRFYLISKMRSSFRL